MQIFNELTDHVEVYGCVLSVWKGIKSHKKHRCKCNKYLNEMHLATYTSLNTSNLARGILQV